MPQISSGMAALSGVLIVVGAFIASLPLTIASGTIAAVALASIGVDDILFKKAMKLQLKAQHINDGAYRNDALPAIPAATANNAVLKDEFGTAQKVHPAPTQDKKPANFLKITRPK